MPEPSILDERLAEIDRRLRTIQSGLVPVPDEPPHDDAAPTDEPEPHAERHGAESSGAERPADPADPAEPAAAPLARDPEPLRLVEPDEPAARGATSQLADLVQAHERLLELHRELLSQYAEVLERRAGERATVAVTAGPFSSADTVREFERALAGLPGVTAVTVREYVGADRVQVDVQLASR
jgi:hypothetical protein